MSDSTDLMVARRIADAIAKSGSYQTTHKAVDALVKGFLICDKQLSKAIRARNELARIADKMASGGDITAKEINSIPKLVKS